jgi:nickel superoxide dismutase
MKKYSVGLMAVVLLLVPSLSRAHCEIPCGIYDDSTRYVIMLEDIATIEKSMNMIIQLSAADTINYNQLVRWVTNKEDHANKFMDAVSQYFLTQRLVPTAAGDANYDSYIKMLAQYHEMLVLAMKCKQTTDFGHVTKLRDLVNQSQKLYFETKHHKH